MSERSREARIQSYNELKSENDRRTNEILTDNQIKQELNETPIEENEPKIGVKKARKLTLKEPKHENVAYKKAVQTGLQGVYTGKKVVEEVTPDNTKQLRQKAKQIAKDENRNQNVVYRQLVEEEYQPATYEKVAVYPTNRKAQRSNPQNKTIIKLAAKVGKTKALKVKNRFPEASNEAIIKTADKGRGNALFSLTNLFRTTQETDET